MAEQDSGFFDWLRTQFRNSFRNPFSNGGRGAIGMGIGALTGNPLLGMALSRVDWNNLGRTLSATGRGLGSSFERMFDNDESTGFFNNPTAPWNWGRGPSNVPEGHRDFIGPPNPFLGAQGAGNFNGAGSLDYGNSFNSPGQFSMGGPGLGEGGYGLDWISQINNANTSYSGPKPGEQGYGVVASGGSGGGSGGRGSVQSSSGRMPGVFGGRLAGSSMIDLFRQSKWNYT